VAAINILEEKKLRIREEKTSKEALTEEDILGLTRKGEITEARANLVFHTDPHLFGRKLDRIVACLQRDFEEADRETRKRFFIFLTKLTLDLVSFLPQWNLKNGEMHKSMVLTDADIEEHAARNEKILEGWSAQDEALARSLLDDWLDETKYRLRVEGVTEGCENENLAKKIVGNSVIEYMDNVKNSFEKSNIRKICELRASGQTKTEIGNDHTTNLEYAMWLGASFVTTNPQLVEIAWELNPELWKRRTTEIVKSRYSPNTLSVLVEERSRKDYEEFIEEVNTDITIEVVYENAKMLRPIFLLSGGGKGMVCLQVNPLKHSNTDSMIHEALYAYSRLTEMFGGVPNIVFKLPATKAGLEAARELTSRGIGVTITVSFGLFQALPFAEVINRGNAIVSYLVVMNGRLADPVIGELKEIGEDVAEAGRWAGIAVAKRLYQKLYGSQSSGGRGYDSKRIRIIVASLRNYEGSFPDITEVVGVPILTVFPNIRRAFDAECRGIDPDAVEKPIDEKILETLLRSELFRQAYQLPEDHGDIKPRFALSLDDNEEVLNYPPVKNTIGQFCEYRLKTGELVMNHLLDLCRRESLWKG